MANSTGGTPPAVLLTLRLRRQVEWVPVAALVLLVLWGVAVASIVEGPNGTAGAIALSVVGVPVAVIAVSGAGHLVRPLRVSVDADGLTVRLPTWPARTVPWSAVSGGWEHFPRPKGYGGASARYVVVDCDARAGRLPRTCRLRAAYRRLAPDQARASDGHGLCFETQIFDLDPAELLDAVRQYAPVGLTVMDETRQ